MLIFELIGCICLAFFVANSTGVLTLKYLLAYYKIWYRKENYIYGFSPEVYTRPIPPLDCAKCLSFWLSLSICIYNDLDLIQSLLFSMIAYTTAKVYSK